MADIGLLVLAFSSGAAAFLNPCSFALLPAFVSYFMGKEETDVSQNRLKGAFRGLKYGLETTLGFATVFLGIGAIVSWIGPQIKSFIPPILLVVGTFLIVLGLLWTIDIPVLSLTRYGLEIELSYSSFFLFGLAYALSSMTCVFPVFLMLLFSSLGAGGITSTLLVFLSFTLGMGLLMTITSTSIVLSKSLLMEKFNHLKKHITRISGIILIAAGTYLIYYWMITYLL